MKPHRCFVPKASLRVHILLLLFVLIVGMMGIGIAIKASALNEAIVATSLAFSVLFIYYLIMIYHGVRYDNGVVRWRWNGMSIKEMLNEISQSGIDVSGIDIPSFDFDDNLIGGLVSALLAILLGVVIAIAVVLLAWIGINLAGYALVFAWIPMYVLVKYGVRLALVNVKYSKGNLLRSIGLAVIHGLLGAIAMGAIFYVTEIIIRKALG